MELEEKMCKKCLFTNKIADVTFNKHGICNYCVRHELLEIEYPNDDVKGYKLEGDLFHRIRENGRGKKYDCVVGISGGCDSSFLLDLVIKENLRPLAVHFDNGWDSSIAVENMENVCRVLNVDIKYRKVLPQEFDDIARSFIIAGVPDIDAASDIGMIAAMYQEAEKHNISYIVEGHSFRTEGIQPISWAYVDGQYISDVHQQYGTRSIDSFPNLWYEDFKRWVSVCQIKRVRPLYYHPYVKKDARRYLSAKFKWKNYAGHHLENEFTSFNYTYYLPRKLNVDERVNEYSALIRSGQMQRKEALLLLREPVTYSQKLVDKVKQRLHFSDTEFERLMLQPLKSYRDLKTYKPIFESEEPFWKEMYLRGIVPKSFYLKYC